LLSVSTSFFEEIELGNDEVKVISITRESHESHHRLRNTPNLLDRFFDVKWHLSDVYKTFKRYLKDVYTKRILLVFIMIFLNGVSSTKDWQQSRQKK